MSGWTYACHSSDLYFLRHRDSGTIICLRQSSNGWFCFIPADGGKPKICYSGVSVSNRDFPEDSTSTFASLKAGGGLVVTEGLNFGSWNITKEDQLLVIQNSHSTLQRLYLTCAGFVFTGNSTGADTKALIVAKGKEMIGNLELGHQALLSATEKAEPTVKLSPSPKRPRWSRDVWRRVWILPLV